MDSKAMALGHADYLCLHGTRVSIDVNLHALCDLSVAAVFGVNIIHSPELYRQLIDRVLFLGHHASHFLPRIVCKLPVRSKLPILRNRNC